MCAGGRTEAPPSRLEFAVAVAVTPGSSTVGPLLAVEPGNSASSFTFGRLDELDELRPSVLNDSSVIGAGGFRQEVAAIS